MDMTEFEKRIQEKVEAREQFVPDTSPATESDAEPPPAPPPPVVPPVATEEAAPATTPPAAADSGTAEAAADAAEAALPDDASEQEVADARAAAEEQFYVAKYRTREEAEEGLKAKDSTIGRLGQRLGALERELAAAKAKPPEPEPVAETQAEELDVPAWEEWAEHQVRAGNGEQGALKALEEGGLPGYELFVNRWMAARDPETGEPDEDARLAAMQFNNAVMLELQQIRQHPQPAAPAAPAVPAPPAPPEIATAEADLQAAEHILEASYPDWRQHQERMAALIPTLPDETRAWLRAEAQIGIAGRARALEYVYLAARQQAQKAQQVADAAAEASGDAAIVAATVTSAEATRTRTPRPEAEQRALSRRNELRKEWGLEPMPDE